MKKQGQEKEEVRERMVDDAKGIPSQSCSLCTALKNEIKKTRINGETDREAVLKFLLKGHQDACHGSK